MTDKQEKEAILIILETLSDAYEILNSLRYYVGMMERAKVTSTINYRQNVISELHKAIKGEDEDDVNK